MSRFRIVRPLFKSRRVAPAGGTVSFDSTGAKFLYTLDNTLADEFGNATALTNNNSVAFVTGPGGVGQAAQCVSSTNSYLDVADESYNSLGSTDYTMLGRYRVDSNPITIDHGFIMKGTGSSEYFHWAESTSGPWIRCSHTSTIYGSSATENSFAVETWVLVSIVFDATANTLSIRINAGDELLITGVTVDPTDSTGNLYFGRRFANISDVSICDMFLASRKWSLSEISDWYNGGTRLLAADRSWT